MQFLANHKPLVIIVALIAALLLFAVLEALYIRYNGTNVPAPQIPRQPITIGAGEPLRYAVLGDSTSIGQGADYEQSIAAETAGILAKDREVTYRNFGVSGATLADVLDDQVGPANEFEPDVVLISAGANDVTHLTGINEATEQLRTIVKRLQNQNPGVRIIFTGAPAVGTAPRFPPPVDFLLRKRTEALNEALLPTARQLGVTVAPIARETRDTFANNPGLFAPDNFHPNAEGYGAWIPVLERALQQSAR